MINHEPQRSVKPHIRNNDAQKHKSTLYGEMTVNLTRRSWSSSLYAGRGDLPKFTSSGERGWARGDLQGTVGRVHQMAASKIWTASPNRPLGTQRAVSVLQRHLAPAGRPLLMALEGLQKDGDEEDS